MIFAAHAFADENVGIALTTPAIGPKTIEGAAEAQLRGAAVAVGHVLILERERCAREADAAGLFVAGFSCASPGG